jgi:hypothetical protein
MSKLGTFFHDVKAFLGKFFTSPTLQQTITTTLTVGGALVEGILAETGNEPAAAEITNIVNQTKTDLAAAATLAKSVTPQSGTGAYAQVSTILGGVNTNLKTLLTAGHVTNPATVAKVTGIVTAVTDGIEALMAEMPAAPAPAATPAPVAG